MKGCNFVPSLSHPINRLMSDCFWISQWDDLSAAPNENFGSGLNEKKKDLLKWQWRIRRAKIRRISVTAERRVLANVCFQGLLPLDGKTNVIFPMQIILLYKSAGWFIIEVHQWGGWILGASLAHPHLCCCWMSEVCLERDKCSPSRPWRVQHPFYPCLNSKQFCLYNNNPITTSRMYEN